MFKKKRKGIFRRRKSRATPSKFAQKRRERYIGRKTKYLISTLLTIFIGTTIYWLYFSSYFNISEVKMTERDITQEELGGKIQEKLQEEIGKNLFTLDTEKISSETKRSFPEIETIEINKNYPNTLEVQFNQYPLVANVIHESTSIKKNYIVNSIGYIMKEDLENPNLPYIFMKDEEPANPELQLIKANNLVYILESKIYFEDKFGMGIKSIEYLKIPREIHLMTTRDFEIWLDIQVPSEQQLKKLKKALIKLDIYNENLEYIDLRIAGANGDKIIYRRK